MRIGIVGYGGAGRAHALRFLKNKEVSGISIFDKNSIQLTNPSLYRGIKLFKSFEEFISDVDAVSICTPDHTHFEYITRSVSYKRPILVEKPMVDSVEQSNLLAQILNGYQSVFAIHHQMRFVPIFQKAKHLIETGYFGPIFYIESNYWHNMRIRNTRFDNWRIKGTGQNLIFGAACHPLDLIMYLLDDYPINHFDIGSKSAYTDYVGEITSINTLLMFHGGVVAKIHTNNCAVYPQFNNLIILGEKASFVDGLLYDHNGFNLTEVTSTFHHKPSLKVNFLNKLMTKVKPRLRTYPLSVYDHETACQVIVENFIKSIEGIEKPLVGFKDGSRVVNLCNEINESLIKS